MRIVDARRLRGPSLGTDGPGAIVEVALSRGEDPKRVARKWRDVVRYVASVLRREAMGEGARVRTFRGGLALYVPAPIDALHAALDLVELGVDAVSQILAGTPFYMQRHARRERELLREFVRERRPRLLALERAARVRGVPFLFDDESVTLGHAAKAVTYPLDALPSAEHVRWRALDRIPVALVTGTNGKTTTTRLVARMAKLAGLIPGNTSSDGVAIDERIVEAGDSTGGESARQVLRDPRVEIAILETARGGLLRRGLAVRDVDAALITNVSADHLGEHGVLDVATLAETKAVVGHAVRRGGKVVLGADDRELVRLAPTFAAERVWFAASARAARRAIESGETTFTIEQGAIVRVRGDERRVLAALDDVPLTHAGAAPHNVKNALAAAALAWALGLPDDAVVAALKTFGLAAGDNPGRGQVITTSVGVRVVLDFGHNPAAAIDLYAWARTLAGAKGRVHAVLTQPGDRSDRAMQSFARAVAQSRIDSAVLWESESLLRGREPRETTAILRRALRAAGLGPRAITVAEGEASAVRAALDRARRGDVVVVSPSLDRSVP